MYVLPARLKVPPLDDSPPPIRRGHRPRVRVLLGTLAIALTAGGFYAVANPAQAAAGSSTLSAGQSLTGGQQLVSSDRRYRLVMQTDGNLVEYVGNRAIWQNGKAGKTSSPVLVMQTDGNLVEYGANNAVVWNNATNGNPGTRLVLQNDANLVLYNGNRVVKNFDVHVTALLTGSDLQLATNIINSPNLRTNRSDSRYIQQIRNYANGNYSCHINPTILSVLWTAMAPSSQGGLNHSVAVSSLNRRCTGVLTASGSSSYHYRNNGGHAVDLNYVDDVHASGATSTDLALLRQLASKLPSGSGIGQRQCRQNAGVSVQTPSGVSQFDDTCNHDHVQVPVR